MKTTLLTLMTLLFLLSSLLMGQSNDCHISLIPNPSFEDYSNCPNGISQFDRVNSWVPGTTNGSSDYWNTCGYSSMWGGPPPSLLSLNPLPDGNGYVGIYSSGAGTTHDKEYISTCLNGPMYAGTPYELSFNIIKKRTVDPPILMTIYGSTSCANLTITSTSFGEGCVPENNPNWIVLGSILMNPDAEGGGQWQTGTINFTPPQNINAIMLGGGCTSSTTRGYYYLDNLILPGPPPKRVLISETGNFCTTNDLTLTAQVDTFGGTWQWYDSLGVVLSGETDSTLDIMPYGEGTYTAIYTLGGQCYSASYQVTTSCDCVNPPVLSVSSQVNETCSESNGAVTVSVNGGTGTAPFNYAWSNGDSTATINGLAAGPYQVIVTDNGGCKDTLDITLNNTGAATNGTDIITDCNPISWLDGNTYSSNNNTATHTLVGGAANGCDSIVTLDFTLNTFSLGTDVISSCGPITWLDGNTYSASNNIATHTIVGGAANGCDSIVTLDFTLNNPTNGTDVITDCNPIVWIDGNTYSASNNTATHTIVGGAANGCDSVVTLDFTLNNPTTGTDVITDCNPIVWLDGNTYSASNNTATHTIMGGSANGCDSIVTLDFTLNNATNGTDVIVSCGPITWLNGNTYKINNNTATHTIVGGSVNGCDSVVTLDFTLNTFATGTDVIIGCDPIVWLDGNTYSASNNITTHTIAGGSVNGCDSVVTLDFTLNNPTTGTDVIISCDPIVWLDGNTYSASNNTATHTIVGGSANGCDSVVILDFALNNPTTGTDVITDCSPIVWLDGNTYSASNNTATHTIVGGLVNGCDSVVILDFTLNDPTTGTDVIIGCDPITWLDGNTYSASNNTATHTIVGGAANGCDSVVALDFTLNNATTGTDVITDCNPIVWLDGNTYSTSNNTAIHTIVGGAANGCDSVVTLDFTLNNATTGTDVITDCNPITWLDGNTYNTSNNTATHTIVGGSVNGCDSVVTLDFMLLPTYNTTINDTICSGDNYTYPDGTIHNNIQADENHTSNFVSSSGCDSTITTNLIVTPLPLLNILGTRTICVNGSSTITATSTGTGPYDFVWDNGLPATAGPHTISPAEGITTYNLTVTDANGCINRDSIEITVYPLPNINAGEDTVVCPNDIVVLTGSGGSNYQWKDLTTGNMISTDATASVFPVNNHCYQLIGVDTIGCSNTDVVCVNVAEPPTADFTSSFTCEGVATVFNNPSLGSLFLWNFGDGASSNVQSPQHMYSDTGVYTVQLTVTNNAGCKDSTSKNIVVHYQPTALFSADTLQSCLPLITNFRRQDSLNTDFIYSWDFGDGNGSPSGSEVVTYTYTETGTYTVSLTVTTPNNCTATFTRPNYIEVYPVPIADFVLDPNITDIHEADITFTDMSLGSDQWFWDFGDSTRTNEQHPYHTYTDTGVFTVWLKVANQYGCMDSISKIFKVNDVYTFYAPNAFTPNGNGRNDVFLPQGHAIDYSHYNLMIFDRWGKLIYETGDYFEGWDGTLNGSLVQIDTYVWKVKLKDIFGVNHNYIGRVSVVK